MTRAMTVTRDVGRDECPWLNATVKAGSTVYPCRQATYGAISAAGIAVTFDPAGGYPFFELPLTAVAVQT